jgi:outer membrane receptor protein involved in Fe transport
LAGEQGEDFIHGDEALGRDTTDAGSLLFKSPDALGVGVQRRTPIMNDPRIRGSRVGQLAASGSYWIPARIDLDTAISKIDSRLIEGVTVIKGPYSSLYGPGLDFLDIELLPSPRFQGGWQFHGATSADYNTNGRGIYGRQTVLGGNDDFGMRFSYGQRAGTDYLTGSGQSMPAGYGSRDADLAVGYDLTPDDHIEFNYLRVDQTNVEFPGMAFDIDALQTNAFEVRYFGEKQPYSDRMAAEIWYNDTHFNGDAQHPGKRTMFPYLNFIHYVGYTDVDAESTGYRLAWSWGADDAAPRLTAGTDLRFVHQKLDEIASGRIGFNIFTNANSPIPKSAETNPGLFVEETLPAGERVSLTAGGRLDFVQAAMLADPQDIAHLGLQNPQSSLADILGTGDFDRSYVLWQAYLRGQYKLNDHWTLTAKGGQGQRAPSLTELYVAQSFMFLLQNGLNTVTGDPRLKPESLWQGDLALNWDYDRFRGSIGAFRSWAYNYITFENLRVVQGPPNGEVVQVNLKYVNTDLAAFDGYEALAEWDVNDWWTPFGTLQYVEGTDMTRNGSFATQRATPGSPSQRVAGLPRGDFSGVSGGSTEPLPGIIPLESRVGIRLHAPTKNPQWAFELSARIVSSQNKVAASLLETPTAGFTTFDLRSYWRVNPHWQLACGVENLTNRNYREYLDFRYPDGTGMYQPGINGYFGTELSY